MEQLRAEAAHYAAQALSPSNREWYQRVVDALDNAIQLRAALRLFVGCAYPVATEINQRGHEWRSEESLDYALDEASKALANEQTPRPTEED